MVDILHRIMSVSMQMLAILVLIISLYRDTWQVNGQICNTPDWIDYGDSQYLIVNTQRTWSDARTYCQDNGGDLAVISSHEQTAFLVTYTLKSTDGWNYWIGLHDSDGDGQFTWIDDTQPQYSNWSPSQPSSSHECVRMRTSYSVVNQGKWQTSSCSNTRVHICQRPKGNYINIYLANATVTSAVIDIFF
ncbi:snaclec CTL-Eoc124-like [Strongylocentrotus purpuratus]|uniref:C-type lectin domain-containing protein n=1 Tax=Strongylocentrotus purpuratus TaxID=7668 RepID=A0A7M7T073_STRPU|nr:snaclec CTL-Eoc124-like [Strongylocentrotus purpuratus]